MHPSSYKTRRTWNEPGHAHFITYSCHRRLPLLTRDRTRLWAIETLAAVRERFQVALWAYVVMPEHVHVLLRPRDAEYDVSRILVALKQPVAKAARQWMEDHGRRDWIERLSVTYPSRRVFRFWQPGGGFDQNVFKEKSVPAIIDYIHANPVRRELVNDPLDWEWSSARFWEGRGDSPLRMDEIDV